MLELVQVGKQLDGEAILSDINLCVSADGINILLGPTLAGKTSLLRIMAGLDRPSSGDLRFKGKSVLGVPVQQRRVAMVYQQFINYPSLTVFDNIASPLRLAKLAKTEIQRQVQAAAELLQISDLLARRPEQLSGGQQQRVALARALAKRAELVLLDEPLANLDYKLREELRADLPRLFAEQGAILVYATTEPSEALLLGGKTAVLHQGRVLQHGSSIEVFRRPTSLRSAVAFSDPPLNTLPASKCGAQLSLAGTVMSLGEQAAALHDADYSVAIRPHHIQLQASSQHCVAVDATATVSEISGSESFVHFEFAGHQGVALIHGIHPLQLNQHIQLYLDPQQFYFFHSDGSLALAPAVAGGG